MDVAAQSFNSNVAPDLNKKIEQYGFKVEGYNWVEYRYISNGQHGGHTQPVAHFCIRVVKKKDGEKTEEGE